MKSEKNLQRMIQLVDEAFNTRRDPRQISVNRQTMERLQRLHPDTLAERRTKNGPVAWMLVFPTTRILMQQFLTRRISEKTLLRKTRLNSVYDCIYLCSALVLPEYRGRGLATKLMVSSIQRIRRDHSIRCLFYWGFSREGRNLARAVAREVALPLSKRKT
jgi:GNAT superfamily N-acetyltransferase